MTRDAIGVVAAMPEEVAPLLARIGRYGSEQAEGFKLYRFEVRGAQVTLIESGMGPRHAEQATRTLIDLARPACLVNYGLGGGVAPETGLGDLVLAQRVLFLEGTSLHQAPQPDAHLLALARQALAAVPPPLRTGTFITAGQITAKRAVAELIGSETAHPVLEMETAAILRVAHGAGVPVLALRAISDAAGEELGFSLEEFCDRELRISLARVLGTVARKPWIIPQLLRLSRNTKRAGESLALGMVSVLEALAQE